MRNVILMGVFVLMTTGISQAVTMDWVTVGNAGNADDDTGYGGVAYEYQIGKYEVTAGQYTEFLNAKAANNTHNLYNEDMWNYEDGCKIEQSGSSGSYSYSVAADYANRPVSGVSWYNSLRFANWLHNGQGSGDTENGAYDMSLGENVVRKPGAKIWLPTEDEWYKAAYHKNDGITDNYWEYPTATDSVPSNALINPDPGNNANFDYTIGSPYYRTEAGEFENSSSPYGTFDQGGNILEWNETAIWQAGKWQRNHRGGVFSGGVGGLHSSHRTESGPGYTYPIYGFRVASVPEPCCLVFFGFGSLALRRRKR